MFDIKKVIVAINRAGKGAIYEGDLIFDGGQPTLVIEWSGKPGCSNPTVAVPLNPSKLQAPASAEQPYTYQDPITDPRKSH